MTNTEKYEEIFNYLLNAMQIAKDLNNDKIFEVLSETGSKIADILDKNGKLANKYCQDCKHWVVSPGTHSCYGKCVLVPTCLFHRYDTCNKWENKE